MPRKYGALLLLTALAACSPTEPTPDPPASGMDLFLLTGQSNMTGFGPVPGYVAPDTRGMVFALQEGEWVPASEPLTHFNGERYGVGPAVSFAAEVLRARPARPIGLVPCAAAGTYIYQWARDTTVPPLFHPSAHVLYDDCMTAARLAAPQGRFRGVLFFQGEQDGALTNFLVRPGQWAALFERFVRDLRADLGEPDLPVVFAQIGQPGEFAGPNWTEVERQQESVRLPSVAMIRTHDLERHEILHYTTPGYVEIGKRFARSWLSLVTRPD